MTDIAQENNPAPRTPQKRIRIATKMRARYALVARLMAEFCEQEGISAENLRALRHKDATAARRRFARLCRAEKVGAVVIGNVLGLDASTVSAYLSDKLVQDKVRRTQVKRAAARAARNIVASV